MGRERERRGRERENERALSRMRTLVQEKERGNYEASTCQQLYTRQHRIHVSYEEEDACVPRGQHMSTTLHTATHAHANTPTRTCKHTHTHMQTHPHASTRETLLLISNAL